MKSLILNLQIDRAAPAIETICFIPAFGPVVVIAGFVVALGFGGSLDRALQHGGANLRLKLLNSSDSRILRQCSGIYWQWRRGINLHNRRLSKNAESVKELLHSRYEQLFNHFNCNIILDKCLSFSDSFSCEAVSGYGIVGAAQ